MSETERRKAANEAVFREINEQIRTLQHASAVVYDEPLQIVCECDRLDCAERLAIPLALYERTRADATLFFVIPGHEDDTVEEVVDTGGGYLIVRKRAGDARDVAEQTDPRG